MTKEVEGQTPSEEEQPPVEPAPVSEEEEAQLSQPGSQDVVSREEFDQAVSELRGIQGEQDKLKHQFSTQFEKTAQELGVDLTQDQKTELRFRKLEEGKTPPAEQPLSDGEAQVNVDPATESSMEARLAAVEESLKPAPTGASVVSPSGETMPSPSKNAEEAATELDELRAETPTSQRTPQQEERAEELMQIIAEEVD